MVASRRSGNSGGGGRMIRKYAEGTTVSVEKSKAEIESTATRYGATEYAQGWSGDRAVLQFTIQGKRLKVVLNLPQRDDKEFLRDKRGNVRGPQARERAYDDELKRRWRVLLIRLKARLEELDDGTPVEFALMPFLMLPNGSTLGEILAPEIDRVLQTGTLPPLLPK